MIVTKVGKYKLLDHVHTRNSSSCCNIEKGSVVEITQISERSRKVISPSFLDWHHWDLPVEAVPEEILEASEQQPTAQGVSDVEQSDSR